MTADGIPYIGRYAESRPNWYVATGFQKWGMTGAMGSAMLSLRGRVRPGALYPVALRCPHLGCQLEWNPDERSWDCPCHGSRFGRFGKLISGPAQTDLVHSIS